MGDYPNIDCLESDWKLFRKKLPGWQEAYMEKLLEEYRGILESDGRASERFWALEKRINSDKQNPGVQANMRDEMAQYVKILENRRQRSR